MKPRIRLSVITSGLRTVGPALAIIFATIKPGENLLLGSYDVASPGAHICAEWAAEPLDRESREVISEASNLDNLIIAHERVRFEDTCRSWLDAVGTSIAVQQKLMRHSDIRTTMNIYGDVVTDEMALANSRVAELVLKPVNQRIAELCKSLKDWLLR